MKAGCFRTLQTMLKLNYDHLPCEYLYELGKNAQYRSFVILDYFLISLAKVLGYFFALLVSTSGRCKLYFASATGCLAITNLFTCENLHL